PPRPPPPGREEEGGGGGGGISPCTTRTYIRKKSLSLASILIAILFLAGCGDGTPKPDGFPDLVSCVITITQDGTPLAGAMVSLIPTDGAPDWVAAGLTDSSGNATIRTYATANGAPKGQYRVAVSKTETQQSQFPRPSNDRDLAAMAVWYDQVAGENLRTHEFVAAQYRSRDNSPLELEITGPTRQTFDVGAAVHEEVRQVN
ncbi:MAG: YbfJ family protein, partial [Planctomycetaceae bacterium]|nr:YbfJ family protein [Planctomycetaceae bacterium]